MADEYRALRHKYRPRLMVGPPRNSADEIRSDKPYAELHREKNSHEGLSRHTHLRELAVHGCNQAVMEEIGALTNLEKLELRWPMRGTENLEPLRNLKKLTFLSIDTPGTKVTDFTPICDLPHLEVLRIENAKHIYELDWMAPMKDRLRILGLEGAIDTNQRIADLEPLAGFSFEALLCISMTLKSKDLTPLHSCPNLRFLDGGVISAWDGYKALEAAKPDLFCNWFNAKYWYPGWRGAPPKDVIEQAQKEQS